MKQGLKPQLYKNCKNCGRRLLSEDKNTGKLRPAISAYPFCGPCFIGGLGNKAIMKMVEMHTQIIKPH